MPDAATITQLGYDPGAHSNIVELSSKLALRERAAEIDTYRDGQGNRPKAPKANAFADAQIHFANRAASEWMIGVRRRHPPHCANPEFAVADGHPWTHAACILTHSSGASVHPARPY